MPHRVIHLCHNRTVVPGLVRHARAVLELARPRNPVLVNLVCDAEVAAARAAADRGSRWVRRYSRIAARASLTARIELAAIAEHMRRDPYRPLELRAFNAAGWPIWEVDAMRDAKEVLDDVAVRLWSGRYGELCCST